MAQAGTATATATDLFLHDCMPCAPCTDHHAVAGAVHELLQTGVRWQAKKAETRTRASGSGTSSEATHRNARCDESLTKLHACCESVDASTARPAQPPFLFAVAVAAGRPSAPAYLATSSAELGAALTVQLCWTPWLVGCRGPRPCH
jgi:hypothetical protein